MLLLHSCLTSLLLPLFLIIFYCAVFSSIRKPSLTTQKLLHVSAVCVCVWGYNGNSCRVTVSCMLMEECGRSIFSDSLSMSDPVLLLRASLYTHWSGNGKQQVREFVCFHFTILETLRNNLFNCSCSVVHMFSSLTAIYLSQIQSTLHVNTQSWQRSSSSKHVSNFHHWFIFVFCGSSAPVAADTQVEPPWWLNE